MREIREWSTSRWAWLLRRLIADVDVDAAVEHSFSDYHARGFAYVNLLRTPRLTAKLYFSDPRRVQHNASGFLVSPHDHAYDFHTFVVRGAVRNYLFERVSQEHLGVRHNEFAYRSALRGVARFVAQGTQLLSVESMDTYLAGEGYYLDAEQIHTIAVPDITPTILFLLQYATQREATRLFVREETPPSLVGLYACMTRDEVVAYLAEASAALQELDGQHEAP